MKSHFYYRRLQGSGPSSSAKSVLDAENRVSGRFSSTYSPPTLSLGLVTKNFSRTLLVFCTLLILLPPAERAAGSAGSVPVCLAVSGETPEIFLKRFRREIGRLPNLTLSRNAGERGGAEIEKTCFGKGLLISLAGRPGGGASFYEMKVRRPGERVVKYDEGPSTPAAAAERLVAKFAADLLHPSRPGLVEPDGWKTQLASRPANEAVRAVRLVYGTSPGGANGGEGRTILLDAFRKRRKVLFKIFDTPLPEPFVLDADLALSKAREGGAALLLFRATPSGPGGGPWGLAAGLEAGGRVALRWIRNGLTRPIRTGPATLRADPRRRWVSFKIVGRGGRYDIYVDNNFLVSLGVSADVSRDFGRGAGLFSLPGSRAEAKEMRIWAADVVGPPGSP